MTELPARLDEAIREFARDCTDHTPETYNDYVGRLIRFLREPWREEVEAARQYEECLRKAVDDLEGIMEWDSDNEEFSVAIARHDAALKEAAYRDDMKLMHTIVEVLCGGLRGAALNSVSEDYPNIAKLISAHDAALVERTLAEAVKHRVLRSDLVGYFGVCSCGPKDREPVDFETEQDWIDHIRALAEKSGGSL